MADEFSRRLDACVEERTAHRDEFGPVLPRLDVLDTRFDQGSERLDRMENHLNDRFEQVDERFERVDERFAHMNDQLDRMNGRFLSMTLGLLALFGTFVTVLWSVFQCTGWLMSVFPWARV